MILRLLSRLLWAHAVIGVALLGADCAGVGGQLASAGEALARGNLAGAESQLSSLIASRCNEVVLLEARLRAAQGDSERAGRLFSQYTTASPGDAKGFYHFASFLLDGAQYPRADAASARAVSLDPELANALVLRGRILAMKGQAGEAEAMLSKACRLEPRNAEAQFQLGVFHDARQQNGKAAEQFKKVVALTPGDPRAHDYLGLNLEPVGEIEAAERAYKKGLRLNRPGPRFDAYINYNYGRFLIKRNRLEAAKQQLDQALQLLPQFRGAFYERAKLNLKLRRPKQARADAETALALKDPGGVILDLQVYYLLARIYGRTGEKELAQKYINLSQSSSVPLKARRGASRGR
jgi:tetratricopeptide (TPR) repeat protein